ncbi:putative asparagine synthase (glutamine-hydrolyzing) [Helianthus anomalus]
MIQNLQFSTFRWNCSLILLFGCLRKRSGDSFECQLEMFDWAVVTCPDRRRSQGKTWSHNSCEVVNVEVEVVVINCIVLPNKTLNNSAKLTVPGGASVACSTAKAIEWDASWSNNLDPSGRAALGVHNAAYKKNSGSISSANLAPSIADNVPRMMDITGPELVIRS